MNDQALYKLKECLELAGEFVKDENSYNSYPMGVTSVFGCNLQQVPVINKKSNDIRAEAESKASKLERQEKCAKLIQECLKYLNTVNDFENTVTVKQECKCK